MDTPNKIHPAMQRLYAEAISRGLIDGEHRQAELARLLNTTSQRVKNWESRGPSKEVRLQIQDLFGIDALLSEKPAKQAVVTNDHLHANVHPGPDIKGCVPLISWVQAGVWNEAIDIYEPGYAEQWLPVLRNGSKHTYALRVQGDSMTAPHGKTYPEGTIIIVDPDLRTPSSGQRVIAKLSGSNAVTFKVYIEEDGRRWLKPLNTQHQPIYDEFRVLGTVTAKYEPE
jgi:SOS-response transcriptional repressor LexA